MYKRPTQNADDLRCNGMCLGVSRSTIQDIERREHCFTTNVVVSLRL